MTQSVKHTEEEIRRLAEASAWRVRLSEADLESSSEFEAWLDASPLNADAWAMVQRPWSAIGEAASSLDVMAARRDALSRARRAGRGPRLTLARAAALAGAAAIAVLVAGLGLNEITKTQVYTTALGERRVITLSDGSTVTLDSSSELKVRYFRKARRLDLVKGQARFDVAHDVRRPFTVHARDETVVATGTAFNVDLTGPKILVALIQGRVTVVKDRPESHPLTEAPSSGKSSSVGLAPGQELIASQSAPVRVVPVSIDRATAWESGQLEFQDEELAAVADRVSHYSAHPVLVDDGVANLRISGVFNAGDTATFVDAVTHYLPVQAIDAPDGTITLRRKG